MKKPCCPTTTTVTGIFDVGYYDYNANVIVTSLENAQDLYDLDDTVHGLMVMLNDPYQAPEVRQNWSKPSGRISASQLGCRKIRNSSTRSLSRKT